MIIMSLTRNAQELAIVFYYSNYCLLEIIIIIFVAWAM